MKVKAGTKALACFEDVSKHELITSIIHDWILAEPGLELVAIPFEPQVFAEAWARRYGGAVPEGLFLQFWARFTSERPARFPETVWLRLEDVELDSCGVRLAVLDGRPAVLYAVDAPVQEYWPAGEPAPRYEVECGPHVVSGTDSDDLYQQLVKAAEGWARERRSDTSDEVIQAILRLGRYWPVVARIWEDPTCHESQTIVDEASRARVDALMAEDDPEDGDSVLNWGAESWDAWEAAR